MIILNPTSFMINQLNAHNEFVDGFITPTPEEFFTDRFFTNDFLATVYPRVKNLVKRIFDKPFKENQFPTFTYMVSVGYGKTVANILALMYWILIISHLKNPKRLFGIAQCSDLALVWIDSSKMNNLQVETFKSIIPYTKFIDSGSQIGSYKFRFNNIDLYFISEKQELLGLNVIGGICEYGDLLDVNELDDCNDFVYYTVNRISARFYPWSMFCKLVINCSDSYRTGFVGKLPLDLRDVTLNGF